MNNHVLAAIQLLGVSGRAEAGRVFQRYEEDKAGQRLPRQPEPIVEPALNTNGSPEANTGRPRWQVVMPPPIGGRENDLTAAQRATAIAKIAFISVLAFIICVMIVSRGIEALG